MPSVVPLLLSIALVLAAAKIGGWLSSRFNQPAVLGKLAAGLLLGPSLLNLFGLPYFRAAHVTETLHELGQVGVIFLMFTAGLEVHLADFVKSGRPALFAGALGVIVPVALGALATRPFGYAWDRALFVGIVLSATSVSISAQALIELGLLRSVEGLTLLGAAVVDDVLAIGVLSAFVALTGEAGTGLLGLGWTIARMLLFLGGAYFLGSRLLPRLARWAQRLPVSEGLMSLVVFCVLGFAWASEALGGVAAITGAFLAGVALSRTPLRDEIQRGMHTLTYALFVPIFMVSIGLAANARALAQADLGLAAVLCLVALVSKLLGAGAGARAGGMTWPQSLRVGVGMVSRGEVGLIIASVGIAAGTISEAVFTVVVVMVLATTLVTPPLLRLAFGGKEQAYARTIADGGR